MKMLKSLKNLVFTLIFNFNFKILVPIVTEIIMVLIDDEVLYFVPSLHRERHVSSDAELCKRSSSISSNISGSRKNSVGSRVGLLDGESRSRCTSISIKTYKPHLISERRRKVEDLCRDLVVNNDHIHVIKMRLRAAIA